MLWKALLAAALVLPPVAYVAGVLYAPDQAPEERPALVLRDDERPARVEPRATLEPQPRPRSGRGDDDLGRGDPGERDEGDDGDDGDDGGDVTVVRPVPQDDDRGDDDGDDGGDDDSDDADDRDDSGED